MATAAGEDLAVIVRIVRRSQSLLDTMREQVDDMCELLLQEVTAKHNIHEERLEATKKHLTDIYWSLKLHLLFHVGEAAAIDRESLLWRLGTELRLGEQKLKQLPGMECATDPATKFLEVLRDIIPVSNECPKDSVTHAEKVKERAIEAFKKHLKKKNIFRPKVLALVSRGNKGFVGSSMAVSNFLRPLCLHNRIYHFKPSLKKSVILAKPLDAAEKATGWSSSAVNCRDYKDNKDPCQNCQIIFQNLDGFITNSDSLANAGGDTFLGACAEYLPVNYLLQDGAYTSPEADKVDKVDQVDQAKLVQHKEQCCVLFKGYRNIVETCNTAYKTFIDSNNEIRTKVHIFGFLKTRM